MANNRREFPEQESFTFRCAPTDHGGVSVLRLDTNFNSLKLGGREHSGDALAHLRPPSEYPKPTQTPQFNLEEDVATVSSTGVDSLDTWPPAPQELLRFEQSNVVIQAELDGLPPLKLLIQTVQACLDKNGCDVLAYDWQTRKWTVESLSGVQFVNFRVRLFTVESVKGIVVEMQRRDGDAAAFRELFGSMTTHLQAKFGERVSGSITYKKGAMMVGPVPQVRSFQPLPFPPLDPNESSASYAVEEVEELLALAQTQYADTKAQAAMALAVVVSHRENLAELEKNEQVVKSLVHELGCMMQNKFLPLLRYAAVAIFSLTASPKAAVHLNPLVIPLVAAAINNAGYHEIGVRRYCLRSLTAIARHMGPVAFNAKHSWGVAETIKGKMLNSNCPQQLEAQVNDLLQLLNG